MEQEYFMVRDSAGIFDFSLEGKIKVSGKDKIDFLQGLVSNDLKYLKTYRGIYAAFLNRFGKILSDCFVYSCNDFLLVFLPFVQKKKILEKLQQEALLSEVAIEDVTLQYALLSVQGISAKNILEAFFQEKLSLGDLQFIPKRKEDIDFFIIKTTRGSVESYDLLFPSTFYHSVLKELFSLGLQKMHPETYEILRLEKWVPLFGIDFDETTLLLELGEDAVSYTKGCYVGQEVIARVKNLAKGITPKKLVRLQIEGEEAFGKNTEIYSQDKKIGFLTSSVYSPGLKKVVALGYVQKGFYDVKEVGIDGRKGILIS